MKSVCPGSVQSDERMGSTQQAVPIAWISPLQLRTAEKTASSAGWLLLLPTALQTTERTEPCLGLGRHQTAVWRFSPCGELARNVKALVY